MSAREWWAIKLRESEQLKHTIAGAGAGLVTSVVTCPLDVVKTRLQNQGVVAAGRSYKGTAGTLTRIWSEEGIRGLYRGLGPTIFGYLPTWAIYFTAYDYFKDLVARQTGHHESNLFVYIVAAMSAGATSTTITNPLWVIKTRFMTQNEHTPYRYNNTLHAFTTIYRVEGLRGFYKGLGSSLMGISHVALQFPLYEKLRQWLKSADTDQVSSTNILAASSTSKMAASIATYPHEVIRTRLQNQSTHPPKYQGIIHACKVIYHEEGIRAFYKGMPTNLLRTVPASALTILTYELLVSRLNELAKPSSNTTLSSFTMYGEEASKLARETKRTIDHFPPYNDPLVRSITREIRHLHETCQALIREYGLQKQQIEHDIDQQWLQQQDSSLTSASRNNSDNNHDPNHTTLAMLEESHPSYSSSSSATLTTSQVSRLQTPSMQAQKQQALQSITEIFWTKYLVHQTPLQRNKRILMAYHHQRLEKIKELAWAYNTLPESSRRLLSPDEIMFFNEYEKQCRNKYFASDLRFGDIDLGLGMISPPKEVFITVRVIRDCGDIVTESGATLSLKKNSEHFVKRGDVERLITQGYLLHVA
ncbi:hypothetical protein BGX28_002224 [Mortierella sp. GBA30]|nr:hypothetical protein BGX28_002224 [Mortierella sp. GBA30]